MLGSKSQAGQAGVAVVPVHVWTRARSVGARRGSDRCVQRRAAKAVQVIQACAR